MASEKILNGKKEMVAEIKENIEKAKSGSVVFVKYQGLPVSVFNEIRRKLKESSSDIKVYKNTLTRLALKDMNISLSDEICGPIAMCYSTDIISPIKVIYDYAKEHPELEMQIGIVDGEVSQKDVLDKLALIPSRDTLLTMLAAGLMGTVKDLSICLDLYSQDLEN